MSQSRRGRRAGVVGITSGIGALITNDNNLKTVATSTPIFRQDFLYYRHQYILTNSIRDGNDYAPEMAMTSTGRFIIIYQMSH